MSSIGRKVMIVKPKLPATPAPVEDELESESEDSNSAPEEDEAEESEGDIDEPEPAEIDEPEIVIDNDEKEEEEEVAEEGDDIAAAVEEALELEAKYQDDSESIATDGTEESEPEPEPIKPKSKAKRKITEANPEPDRKQRKYSRTTLARRRIRHAQKDESFTLFRAAPWRRIVRCAIDKLQNPEHRVRLTFGFAKALRDYIEPQIVKITQHAYNILTVDQFASTNVKVLDHPRKTLKGRHLMQAFKIHSEYENKEFMTAFTLLAPPAVTGVRYDH